MKAPARRRLLWPVAIAVALAASVPVQARIVQQYTCVQRWAGSDLIVVAIPTSRTRDTRERTQFSDDVCAVHESGPCTRLPAIGVETEFRVVQVLKGARTISAFTLHHFREPAPTPDPTTGQIPLEISGPFTVSIDRAPALYPHLLLFLLKESDGRYAPFGGQTDPGLQAVFSASHALVCPSWRGLKATDLAPPITWP